MKKLLGIVVLVLLAGSTTIPVKTEVYSNVDPQNKNIVFLNSTDWDHEFRVSLQKHGFKVFKFASREKITKRSKDFTEEKTFNKAEARYALDQRFRKKDYCPRYNSDLLEAKIEVVDLRANEVVMYFQREGWTTKRGETSCWTMGQQYDKYLFEILAKEINDNWK